MAKQVTTVNGRSIFKGDNRQPSSQVKGSFKQVPVTVKGNKLAAPVVHAEPANLVKPPKKIKKKKKTKFPNGVVLQSGRVLKLSKDAKKREAAHTQKLIRMANSGNAYSTGIAEGVADRIMAEAKNRPLAIDGVEPHGFMSKEKARNIIRQNKLDAQAAARVQAEEVIAPAAATAEIIVPASLPKFAPVKAAPEEKPFFDAKAYNLAIRTMTTSEAWKMARDINAVGAFYASLARAKAPEDSPKEVPAAPERIKEVRITPAVKPAANDVKATGSTQIVEVRQRRADEQADFKRRVRANFGGRCAISGDASDVNQGCHLEGFAVNHNNSTSNGILLSPTFHTMLDRGLLGIHPERLTIHFAEDGVFKTLFDGQPLQPHGVALDKAALAQLWEGYKGQK